MRIFIDTEFTDLMPGASLISIALATETGNFFYAELNNTYQVQECSNFVKESVLPYLKGGKYVMSEEDCASQMVNWIKEQGPDCILAYDNISWDRPYFEKLIDKIGTWPENLSKDDYIKFQIIDFDVTQIVQEYNLDVHNALDDVTVMYHASKRHLVWDY